MQMSNPSGSILITPMAYVMRNIVYQFNFKLMGAFLSWAIGYFIFEDKTALLVLFALMCLDWFTGCWAALKHKEFASWKFRQTLIKGFVYYSLIGMFHISEHLSPYIAYLKIDVLAISYLGVTELLSCVENFGRISPDFKLPDWVTNKLRLFKNTGKYDVDRPVEPPKTESIEPKIEDITGA